MAIDFEVFAASGEKIAQVKRIIPTEGTMQILPIQGVPTLLLNGVLQGTGQVGIRLLGIATLPQATPGTFSWVQLVNSDIAQIVKSTGPVE